jgi:tetratricopeptide (TPR) repeat protein
MTMLGARTKQTARRMLHGASVDEDEGAAKELFAAGERFFSLGMFQSAIIEYEAAFEAKPYPEFLFNIGQCYRNLGNNDKAAFYFQRYLELKPKASNRDDVLGIIANLKMTAPTPALRPRVIRAGLGLGGVALAVVGLGIAIGTSGRPQYLHSLIR